METRPHKIGMVESWTAKNRGHGFVATTND